MGRTREAALSGALAAVAKYGSRKATMGDIATLAGIAKATLYNHFRTRDDVYAAVVVAEIDAVAAAVTESSAGFAAALVAAATTVGANAAVRRVARDEPAVLASLATPGDGPGWRAARAHIARRADRRWLPVNARGRRLGAAVSREPVAVAFGRGRARAAGQLIVAAVGAQPEQSLPPSAQSPSSWWRRPWLTARAPVAEPGRIALPRDPNSAATTQARSAVAAINPGAATRSNVARGDMVVPFAICDQQPMGQVHKARRCRRLRPSASMAKSHAGNRFRPCRHCRHRPDCVGRATLRRPVGRRRPQAGALPPPRPNRGRAGRGRGARRVSLRRWLVRARCRARGSRGRSRHGCRARHAHGRADRRLRDPLAALAKLPSMRRWLCKVRSLPSLISKCLPRAMTSTTLSPVRSVVTRSAIRSSARTSSRLASAVRSDRAASHTVFPSGTVSLRHADVACPPQNPASFYATSWRGCYRRCAGGRAGISLSTLGVS